MPPSSTADLPLENPWSLAAAVPRELDVGQGHRLWWAQGGSTHEGAPVVLVIHGGPGGRSRDEPLNWLAGTPVRWLCWDQRGCGRSRWVGPGDGGESGGELAGAGPNDHNDLDLLLHDIDLLLAAAQVGRVAILAGSWGAVPALEYARTRAGRVTALMLRSAFLGSRAEVDAFFEPWAHWLGEAGKAWLGRDTVSRSGALAWLGPNAAVSARLAWAWSEFEGLQAAAGGLARSGTTFNSPAQEPQGDAAGALEVQAHFLMHDCFLPADVRGLWQQSLAAAPLGPIVLVHGADDAVCPVASTEWLARLWPQARVEWVADAGHRMGDPQLGPRLREAAQAWALALVALQGERD